jgi:hypothetical protein
VTPYEKLNETLAAVLKGQQQLLALVRQHGQDIARVAAQRAPGQGKR